MMFFDTFVFFKRIPVHFREELNTTRIFPVDKRLVKYLQ